MYIFEIKSEMKEIKNYENGIKPCVVDKRAKKFQQPIQNE